MLLDSLLQLSNAQVINTDEISENVVDLADFVRVDDLSVGELQE
jgi:hypothetical protein